MMKVSLVALVVSLGAAASVPEVAMYSSPG